MHFDEVYHARTATEFLQDWRYGQSHDIYEWTHPAPRQVRDGRRARRCGATTRSPATSDLGVPVRAAAIEPRRDDPSTASAPASGVHIATGDERPDLRPPRRGRSSRRSRAGRRRAGRRPVRDALVIGSDDGRSSTLDLDARSALGGVDLAASTPSRAGNAGHPSAPARDATTAPHRRRLGRRSYHAGRRHGPGHGHASSSRASPTWRPAGPVPCSSPTPSRDRADPAAVAAAARSTPRRRRARTTRRALGGEPTGRRSSLGPPGRGETRTAVDEAITDGACRAWRSSTCRGSRSRRRTASRSSTRRPATRRRRSPSTVARTAWRSSPARRSEAVRRPPAPPTTRPTRSSRSAAKRREGRPGRPRSRIRCPASARGSPTTRPPSMVHVLGHAPPGRAVRPATGPSTSSSRTANAVYADAACPPLRARRLGHRRRAATTRPTTRSSCWSSTATGTVAVDRHRLARVRLAPAGRDRRARSWPRCLYLLARILFRRRSWRSPSARFVAARRDALRPVADRHERRLRRPVHRRRLHDLRRRLDGLVARALRVLGGDADHRRAARAGAGLEVGRRLRDRRARSCCCSSAAPSAASSRSSG